MCIYIYICIYLYKSRGVAFIGYYVPDNAEKEEEGEKRERDTFFTILPTHGVSAAATLSHKVQRDNIHVPIDSGPFCVDQNWLYFGTAVSR